MTNNLSNFGFLLSGVNKRYVSRFEQRAQEIALTLPTCKVIAYLERNEGVSQSRLAELTGIDPMAMVRMLDLMEAEGLVERKPDPSDRRARKLYLTPKAAPTLEKIWSIATVTREETFTGVSESERDLFISLLLRLDENLSRLD